MNDRIKTALGAHSQLKGLQRVLATLVIETRQEAQRSELDAPSLVDLSWVLRELSKYGEQIEKECRLLRETLERVTCAVWVAQCAADPEAPADCRGEFAVGTPRARVVMCPPERGSDEYVRLMRHLGCPESLINADVLRPHYPHLCDLASALTSEGRPLPPGIDPGKTKPNFTLHSLRLQKGVNIEDLERQSNGKA